VTSLPSRSWRLQHRALSMPPVTDPGRWRNPTRNRRTHEAVRLSPRIVWRADAEVLAAHPVCPPYCGARPVALLPPRTAGGTGERDNPGPHGHHDGRDPDDRPGGALEGGQ